MRSSGLRGPPASPARALVPPTARGTGPLLGWARSSPRRHRWGSSSANRAHAVCTSREVGRPRRSRGGHGLPVSVVRDSRAHWLDPRGNVAAITTRARAGWWLARARVATTHPQTIEPEIMARQRSRSPLLSSLRSWWTSASRPPGTSSSLCGARPVRGCVRLARLPPAAGLDSTQPGRRTQARRAATVEGDPLSGWAGTRRARLCWRWLLRVPGLSPKRSIRSCLCS